MASLALSDTHSAVSTRQLSSDSLRQARLSDEISRFLHPDESVIGFGYGGSESITIIIQDKLGRKKVRKILNGRFIATRWDRHGRDVMLPPHLKAERQARWLQNVPGEAKSLFPEVFGLKSNSAANLELSISTHPEFIYDMSYVPGVEFSRFVREYKPSPVLVAFLYSELFIILKEQVHRHRRRAPKGPTLETSYFSKIDRRLALCHKTAPRTFPLSFLGAPNIRINGTLFKNVPVLLDMFRKNTCFRDILEPRYHSLVVGDTNTENIKIENIAPLAGVNGTFDFSNPPFRTPDLGLRFLDPRAIGFHEDGVDTGSDDPMYDNKPWHNSLGNYDFIHGEHFDFEANVDTVVPFMDINIHEDNPYAESYRNIGDHFYSAMIRAWDLDNPESDFVLNDPYWLIRFVFVMGTHFMAMPPFHFGRDEQGELVDDPSHQRRPLAIYAEGIKWLNLAVDMLEGRVREYLGFEVPELREIS